MIFQKIFLSTISLFFSILMASPVTAQNSTLKVTIQNIQKAKGNIMIAVFRGEANFLEDDKDIASKIALVEKTGELTVVFPNLPFGNDYAVAVYHDLNGNGALNTNLFGVPTEAYGFSNNARSKWGAPKYNVARFELNELTENMVIQVKKWSRQ
ncbi:MAG: DUF2141 domain-containing protein [Saprospiraceae bacterium]